MRQLKKRGEISNIVSEWLHLATRIGSIYFIFKRLRGPPSLQPTKKPTPKNFAHYSLPVYVRARSKFLGVGFLVVGLGGGGVGNPSFEFRSGRGLNSLNSIVEALPQSLRMRSFESFFLRQRLPVAGFNAEKGEQRRKSAQAPRGQPNVFNQNSLSPRFLPPLRRR